MSAVNILSYDANCDQWNFDTKTFRTVLSRPDLLNVPVAVIAVVGKKRIGKSLFLNYVLRFLRAPKNSPSTWIGPPTEPIASNEFYTSSGSATVTEGIWIWSEPFLIETERGQVAVVLLDCEGLYGDGRDTNVSSRIFGIASALSSHLIFNVHEGLSTEDLLNLDLFTSIGRAGIRTVQIGAGDENSRKQNSQADHDQNSRKTEPAPKYLVLEPTFQQLTFLVRSWRYPSEYEFGANDKFLDRNLRTINSHDCDVIKKTKLAIQCEFKRISCYLLPDPGSPFIYDRRFRGEHKHFSESFKSHLNQSIESLFSDPYLVVKQISSRELTCHDLIQVFASIGDSQERIPNIPSIRSATVIAFGSVTVGYLTEKYEKLARSELFEADNDSRLDLEKIHCRLRSELLQEFRRLEKITTVDEDLQLEAQLIHNLDQKFIILLGSFEELITHKRSNYLVNSIRAATFSITSLAVTIVETGLTNYVLIGEIWGTGFGYLFGFGLFGFGATVSLFNLIRWWSSSELVQEILKVRTRLRNTEKDTSLSKPEAKMLLE